MIVTIHTTTIFWEFHKKSAKFFHSHFLYPLTLNTKNLNTETIEQNMFMKILTNSISKMNENELKEVVKRT
ncbi:hypothetical protein [Campylobacter mucosalis]|uniref:hypothetical protein n=1 Tax=Campylobacter mucosalis TaxID=202 RepID=UPI0015525B7F|nr:hypothetical protein [Campylobacter mucosalis]